MTQPSSTSEYQGGHVTVLLDEAVRALSPVRGGIFIDGTFGGGGHTRRLLETVDGDATVIAIDADPAAIERANALRATPLGRGVRPVQDERPGAAEIGDARCAAHDTTFSRGRPNVSARS